MGRADFYSHGDPNVICDRCGFKIKKSQSRSTWDNLIVCEKDWEPRHPQDFVSSRRDRQVVPNARPEPEDVFLSTNEVTIDDL